MSLAFLLYCNWRRCYYRKPSLQCLHSTGSIIDVLVHVQIMCIDIHTPYHAPELLLIGMFYYMLGNLRPELRSTQRSIQLIACVTSKNLEAYGFAAVLDPFIKDVNILANVMLYLAIAYVHTIILATQYICRKALILRSMVGFAIFTALCWSCWQILLQLTNWEGLKSELGLPCENANNAWQHMMTYK